MTTKKVAKPPAELAKSALAELRKSTGYKTARRENPHKFIDTPLGRSEHALETLVEQLKAPPKPPPKPVPTGKALQLAEHFTPTHQTGGLPGYPAVDLFAAAGTVALSPANGVIDRLSGHPVTPRATPGGPYGLSCYLTRVGGGRYFLTHFGSLSAKVGQRVKKGQPLGTVADYTKATGGITPSHIHEGLRP
jgi:murein DD-endopeptidase MepM/ murein hydrolase activator NlpD